MQISPLVQPGILIVDYGSQTTQLIARRLREQNIYAMICQSQASLTDWSNVRGVILSGGPGNVGAKNSLALPEGLFKAGCPQVPVLGICYGMQLLTQAYGGAVTSDEQSEFGRAEVHADGKICQLAQALLNDLAQATVWMSHGDSATQLPDGLVKTLASENNLVAAVRHEEHPVYGVQFHPEVSHTVGGSALLQTFAQQVCQCPASWNMHDLVPSLIKKLQDQIGERGEVILGLSGGVDSLVAGVLLHKAIGQRLHCVMVDNGLLRQAEVAEVEGIAKKVGLNLTVVDASKIFYQALLGVADPEQKRKVIGHQFIEVFANEQKRLSVVQFLAQGTIYPDVIESASADGQAAVTIKTHHNVGGLPDDLSFELVEPLRDLFKDEVRRLGAELGLAPEFLGRHPFPGPGLGVRVLGEVTADKVALLQQADEIFLRHLREAGVYDDVAQAFCVYLPVESVAVVGDARRYAPVIALRAVVTDDFMTATWAPLAHDLLGAVSREIVNTIPGVSRVVYDITSKPPATIEWE